MRSNSDGLEKNVHENIDATENTEKKMKPIATAWHSIYVPETYIIFTAAMQTYSATTTNTMNIGNYDTQLGHRHPTTKRTHTHTYKKSRIRCPTMSPGMNIGKREPTAVEYTMGLGIHCELLTIMCVVLPPVAVCATAIDAEYIQKKNVDFIYIIYSI